MTTITAPIALALEKLRQDALECPDTDMRWQYIDAANRLISELQNSGEVSQSEALDIRRNWSSAYAVKRGWTLAAAESRHVQ